jgi:hypothetical protein
MLVIYQGKTSMMLGPCHGEKGIMAGFNETQAIFSPAMIPYDLFGEWYVSILGPLCYDTFQLPRVNIMV